MRKVNLETIPDTQSDTLSILYLVVTKGSHHGARCGKTDTQRENRQARDCLRWFLQKGYSSILQRLQDHDIYRESPQAVGWIEDTCGHVDQKPKQDRSYIASGSERQRYANNWKPALNAQGRNAPMTESRLLRSCQGNQRFASGRRTGKSFSDFTEPSDSAKKPSEEGQSIGVPGAHHLRPRHGQGREPGGPQKSEEYHDNRNTRRRLYTFSSPDDEQARSAILLQFPCEHYHKGVTKWIDNLWEKSSMCQPTTILSEFIAKQVLCRPHSYLKQEPNVRTLWPDKKMMVPIRN